MQLIHNLGIVALCCLISAAVLLAELAIAAKIDKRNGRRRNDDVLRSVRVNI